MFIFEKIKEKFDFAFKLNELFNHKEKIEFLLVIFLSLLTAFFQAIGIASVLPFISIVMNPNIINENKWLNWSYYAFNFEETNSFIIFSGFVILALLVVGNAVSAFSAWLNIRFVWGRNYRLSVSLLGKYLSMPYAYFLNQNTADLSKNILSEVQQLASKLLLSITKIITDGIQIIIILGMLLFINFSMTLMATVILGLLYFFIYFNFSVKLKIKGRERMEKNMERFKSANEALGGIKDIKIIGAEYFFLNKFSKNSEIYSKLQSWYHIISQMPRYFVEVVAFGGVVGIIIFFISFNKPIQEIIPLVSLFAFAGYRLMPAFQEVFNSISTIKFNKAILDRIHRDIVMECKGVIMNGSSCDKYKKIEPISFKNKIQLKNVYFSYPNCEKYALRNINLEIKKNTFIALIGETGSGKTTLVDLILGLFSPQKGKFEIDGVEIGENNAGNWRANLGYVPQQIYLSDDTIARNIAFGLPDVKINMDKLKKAAKMANIDSFIEKELPLGYNTNIGERGIRLSGGQKQRIGIARALYYDPQVIILDEATSSLDDKTEKEVLEAIEGIAKLKTMIVIAHRLTTVKNCDQVYVIDKGKIVDEGSYSEIISNKASNNKKM
ncbi:MAG: ABC transporter related protein [Candidatus Moranbacteria bacterium GW2011_GWF2_36_839]|nr:MAG: ABC transporter related protein [Candidatus Moranbacteria bacterium GW2011_GWF1_36_78]KKQ17667.1 MAG: ABC transporter related protein [Candidatus Moranbacteria bacterium GW2011_GWF2_36_839]HAT73370.1 ABC transporter [Candidatus Moranbacteria bacterium]HBY10733.1 ABC transporter [Candidatus Moranbacteria bacterium]